jgi:hypothetical protein
MSNGTSGRPLPWTMIDLLDILAALPFDWPPSTSRRRSRNENVSGVVGLVVLPAATFAAVLFGALYEHPPVALVVVPAVATLVCVLVCRALGTSGRWTAKVAVGCALSCLLCSFVASLLGAIASFYSGF